MTEIKGAKMSENLDDGISLEIVGEHPPFEEAFPGVDTTPVEGDFEQRLASLNSLIDDEVGVGKSGWTTTSGIVLWSKKYGSDVVQALLDQKRLSF